MRRHYLLALALLLAPPAFLQAAVDVIVHQPPPGSASIEQLYRIEVVNRDATSYSGVYLRIEVYDGPTQGPDARRVAWADTEPFDLAAGEARIIAGGAVALVRPGYMPGYEVFVRRTGSLPDGDYTVRVTLMSQTGARLAPPGEMTYRFRNAGPPALIAPYNGSLLQTSNPILRFLWAPPAPMPTDFARYALMVHKVNWPSSFVSTEGNSSFGPDDAGWAQAASQARRSPPAFADEDIVATSFQCAVPQDWLRERVTYVWEVKALNSANAPVGTSDEWHFSYEAPERTEFTLRPSQLYAGSSAHIVFEFPDGAPAPDAVVFSGSGVGCGLAGLVSVEPQTFSVPVWCFGWASPGIRDVTVRSGSRTCTSRASLEVIPGLPEGTGPCVISVAPAQVRRGAMRVEVQIRGLNLGDCQPEFGPGITVRSWQPTVDQFSEPGRPGDIPQPVPDAVSYISAVVDVAADAPLGSSTVKAAAGDGRGDYGTFNVVK